MLTNDKTEGALFEKSHFAVCRLVDKFTENKSHYLSKSYQEAEVRNDFINKLFIYLGWDVNHEDQIDLHRQEVKIEKSVKRLNGRADYAFSISPH